MQTHVEMRAFLTHEAGQVKEVFAVPLDTAIGSLEALLSAASHPTRVDPRFRRSVVKVGPDTILSSVLEIIRSKQITYFPVFDDEAFIGVVTGNGLAHWLAAKSERLSLIETTEVKVREVLEEEEDARRKATFIHKRMPIQEAFDVLSEDPLLEVLLVTESGKLHETPIGIVTPSDAAEYRHRP